MKTRSFKLLALALLAGGFVLMNQLLSASAHDGHKKGHAPATAKRLRNPVKRNTANIENGKALYEENCAVCHGSDGKGAYPKDNTGAHEITNRPEDMGRFKAPSLRNIAVTAPYMHDGSIGTLEEVIDHYADGGRTIRTGEFKGASKNNPNKSAFVKGFRLTAQEKRDLIAFLKSLTDEKFLRDPRFSDPWTTLRR